MLSPGVKSAKIPLMTTDPSAPPQAPIADADEALAELVAGNKRFVSARPEHGHDVAAAAAVSALQKPHAVVVGCIDSRVPLEAIFDQTFGQICVVRSGGHVADRAVLGSVAFAVADLGVPLVMVLGHKRCGAVAATVEAVRAGTVVEGDIGYLVEQIASAVGEAGDGDPEDVMRVHVGHTVAQMAEIPEVASRGVPVVGAVYDLDTGLVELLR